MRRLAETAARRSPDTRSRMAIEGSCERGAASTTLVMALAAKSLSFVRHGGRGHDDNTHAIAIRRGRHDDPGIETVCPTEDCAVDNLPARRQAGWYAGPSGGGRRPCVLSDVGPSLEIQTPAQQPRGDDRALDCARQADGTGNPRPHQAARRRGSRSCCARSGKQISHHAPSGGPAFPSAQWLHDGAFRVEANRGLVAAASPAMTLQTREAAR